MKKSASGMIRIPKMIHLDSIQFRCEATYRFLLEWLNPFNISATSILDPPSELLQSYFLSLKEGNQCCEVSTAIVSAVR